MQNVTGLTAVVTGGGDGIGRALCCAMAREGMKIAVSDIREDAADETVALCKRAGAQEAAAFRCDVSLPDEIEAMAEKVRATFGPVHLVWANAGLGIAHGIVSAKREALRWMYGVNLDGVIDTVRAFVPHMLTESGWRHVGVTASMAALTSPGDGAPAAYAGSKYAVLGVAEALRAELAPQGIGVTALCPGLVNTRIWDGARARPERFGGPRQLPETVGERWRTDGMDVGIVGTYGLDQARRGAFWAVLPTDGRADAIETRTAEICAGIMPSN